MATTGPQIATETIYFGDIVAHYPGEVVPDENVKLNGWEKFVSRAGTQAAAKAVDSARDES